MTDPQLPPAAPPYTPPSAPLHPPSGLGPAPDHMLFAILATAFGSLFTMLACCCIPIALPTGIVAIVQANKTKAFNAAANYEEAMKSSGQAKTWSIVTAVLGGLGLLMFFASLIFNVAFNPEMLRQFT